MTVERENTYWVVVWTFHERFTSLVVETRDLGWIIREVVYSAGRKMYPTVRDAVENYLVGDIDVHD